MYAGYIYILSNVSMPGILKIGFTTNSPEDRVKDLSRATGVPTPFTVAFFMHVTSTSRAEREIHLKLDKYRVSANREFFTVPLQEAIKIIQEVAKEYPGFSHTGPSPALPTPAVPSPPGSCVAGVVILVVMSGTMFSVVAVFLLSLLHLL